MVGFFVASVGFTALSLVLGLPLFLVAHRQEQHQLIRQFFMGAVVVGVICGVLDASSQRLVDDCERAGNPQCFDYGSTGLQSIAVAAYATIAWIKAYLLVSS